jgi:hypothetical protein
VRAVGQVSCGGAGQRASRRSRVAPTRVRRRSRRRTRSWLNSRPVRRREAPTNGLLTDETSWPEARQTLWLWIFVAIIATWHYVAGRGKERVENVLDGCTGWLMSDGWGPYRHDPRRLHCWAHLIRKARGLAQSMDREARTFGRVVLTTLETLVDGGVRCPGRPTRRPPDRPIPRC